MTDYVATTAMHQSTWGTFLEPDPALAEADDLHEALHIPIQGGHHAEFGLFAGKNAVFDRTIARIESVDLVYEDQCSAYHYFDLFTRVERCHGELSRLVDVGVFMGGSAAVLAGCVEPMGLELDLVDVNDVYLRFTHERLRRAFPRAMTRVRMFHGDLATYVACVLTGEPQTRAMVHHDGAHNFDQVVKDLSSLFYVRDRVHSLAIQATHLRGDIAYLNFVDAAVHAMFGIGVKYEAMGARFPHDAPVTHPNQWDGNYFLADTPEGMYVRFDSVEWKYPHPSMELETFLPVKADPVG
ncbi:class I SAM-dependent methyltransferase [Actinomadura sp. NPDC049382]|uniref:class I SAM-dependent methyltransferase n=1 Tax=Actinomadura sp. NPDC049382 TaxID=3158220 RepID=UPI0034232E9A